MTTLNLVVQDNGMLPEGLRKTVSNILHSFSGKKVKLTIIEAKEKRTLDQNSYYWGVIVPHIRKVRYDMGDPLTKDQVHEDLLEQFAPSTSCKRLDASFYSRPMRSKEMSVEQMAAYITAITGTIAEFGHPVPILEGMYAH